MAVRCICLFLLFCSLVTPASDLGAGDASPTPRLPIRSASEIDYPPFCVVDAEGRADGFSVELMRAALAAMGREVSFRTGPWAEVKGWLERGEVQALPLVGRTPEREAVFDFTVPYLTLHGAIVVRADNGDIRSLADLKGRRVAVMKNDNAEEFLRREAGGIEIHTTATFQDALQELARNLHDAVVIQRLVAVRLIQEGGFANLRILPQPIEGFRQDFCFAVREGDRDTLALLNEGLALVIADGTYRRLYSTWFAALELPNRRIVIGGDQNYPPYEFLDGHGRPAGYNVDLIRAVAREVGLDVEIRLGPWPEIKEALARGEIDAIEGMFYSAQRDMTFDFSAPHSINHNVSVVRRADGDPPATVAELAGKRIVVERDDLMHEFAVQHGLTNGIGLAATQEAALGELAAGRYDCALVARLTALYWIKKNGWDNLIVGKQPLLSSEYCFAVPQGHKALLAELTEGLKAVEDNGEYRRIYQKWMGVYEEGTPNFAVVLRYVAMVAGPLLILLLGFFLWSWSLRKEVGRRTQELADVSNRHLAMLAAVPDIIMEVNERKVYTWANEAGLTFFGPDVIGTEAADYFVGEQQIYEQVDRLFGGDEGVIYVESRQRRMDGQARLLAWWCRVLKDKSGKVAGALSTARDITEQKQAEEALRDAEKAAVGAAREWQTTFDATRDAIWVLDREHRIKRSNKAAEQLFGQTKEQMLGRQCWEIMHHGDTAIDHCPTVRTRQSLAREILELETPAGWFAVTADPILDAEGKYNGTVHIISDITDRKREEMEREKMQAQFLQAQKMESIGRLAGGVAHDFNNMLSVIMGYAEMAMESVPPGQPLHADLMEIYKAASRSSAVTRQLLAFARKQTIAPVVIDLNETIESMLKMLRRLIGEDIELLWKPGKARLPVKMDPSQLDQVLANLCVNARDAIKDVGRVTIETDDVTFAETDCTDRAGLRPGDYVLLAVGDNGCGMDAQMLANIFEPFFTTKGVGQGTGLGLSTVYGIVQQNNGFIEVWSEPDQGTAFRIYLPRHAGHAPETLREGARQIPLSRGETILLAEDDASLLNLCERMLKELGYAVISASSPSGALHMAETHNGRIDLLVTDVIMPEMNGRDLGNQLRARRPGLKTLFMSGYSADVIAHREVLDEDVCFISKPFTKKDLAVKVREALERVRP